jgi:endogenous inhibitor of DNA gyrase (YacG/DUF329 family)
LIKLTRYCPNCNKEIIYSNKNSLRKAKKNNSLCISCNNLNRYNKQTEYVRKCPNCNKDLFYKDNYGLDRAIKINSICTGCASRIANKSIELINIKREKSTGKNNPMYGKSVYSVWKEKYGETIANEKMELLKYKQKINSTGKNNPMYGKPAPKKTGNGWSGYYCRHYFRSLLELYYLKYLIDNNINFENGEKTEYSIKYSLDNIERTYFPDFYLIDTQEIIEIKPKKLMNLKRNKAKFKAAKNKYGNKFIILQEEDLIKIPLQKMYELYLSKILIWDEKYKIKFIEKYKENNND